VRSYGFFWVVLSCVPLLFSLDCPPFCASTVFSALSTLVGPCGFLWVQSRENRRGTQERTTQKKPQGHTRTDNPEKTVGEHKKGKPRGPCGFLWVVLSYVPLQFSVDFPPLRAATVFSGLSTFVCLYGFLWIVRENRRGTKGWTIQRKP
jgi:hypothetical protein